MGTMTIDGRKVEFTDERNVLTVIRKAGIRMTVEEPLPPVLRNQGTAWLFIQTQERLRNTGSW